MKNYKIKYQQGSDIFITFVKAECKSNAMYLFYIDNLNTYILEIEEVNDEWNGDIKRIGNLSLGYKTYIGKESCEKDIEICQWNLEDGHKWTIASFEYDDDEICYYLKGCGDRLKSKNIDWEVFGLLVQKAYKILNRRWNINAIISLENWNIC